MLITLFHVGPDWLGSKTCLAKIMASQNLGLSKLEHAKVRAKNVGIHLVECHDIVVSTFFSYEMEEVSSYFAVILAI